MTDIVVGSGPSGVSVATALLARGRQVLMIDGGGELEAEAIARRDALAAKAPSEWQPSEREAYQDVQFAAPEGQTRRYGSDFAQEPADSILAESSRWFGLRASRAVGGLSNVWGSAVFPNRQADIHDWPITVDDLKPHYSAVAEFMPVAGQQDNLEHLLPGFSVDERQSIPPSPQASELLKRLTKNHDKLSERYVHFGAARQAVDVACRQCGMCLHGCPWGHIYSSARTLAALRENPDFTYSPGRVVTGFSETSKGVTLSLGTGEKLRGTRLFLAAGVLETARIVLASSPSIETLVLKDSQHAFVPMLHRWRSPRRPDEMPFTTLPQVFLELDDPAVSPYLVHSQIYTWNEHYARDLIANYGRKLPGSGPLWHALARRLIVAQMFLHSDHSPQIGLKLSRDGRLDASLHENSKTATIFKSARSRLSAAMSHAGMITLGFASRVGAPGSSFHSGGTVPMAANPVEGYSDILGRPHGLNRVHVVDASVLPSIPATTITFSVMANAHRIGTLAP